MSVSRIALATALIAIVAALALATPRPDDDPDEARAVNRQTFVDNCLICHGEDMTSKGRLTAKQWATEVDKMIGWGAPVPPEKKAGLLTYLTTSYSDKVPPPPPDLATADDLIRDHADLSSRPTSTGDATRGGPLYTQNCATCHGATGQGGDLGPILLDRPILVRDAAYHAIVRKGLRKMPGFAAVLSGAQEDDLLAWLRRQRVGPPLQRP